MLILARKVGESIVIGENITLTVLGFNRNHQVKLGIDAPKEVSVHREEIFLKIKGQEGSQGNVLVPVSEETEEISPTA